MRCSSCGFFKGYFLVVFEVIDASILFVIRKFVFPVSKSDHVDYTTVLWSVSVATVASLVVSRVFLISKKLFF